MLKMDIMLGSICEVDVEKENCVLPFILVKGQQEVLQKNLQQQIFVSTQNLNNAQYHILTFLSTF